MACVNVAVVQMAMSSDRRDNLATAERLVREAASRGGQIIVLPELFETPYFCKEHDYAWLDLACPVEQNPAVKRLSIVARELGVVLPVSVFEHAGNLCFNTVVMIDADGEKLGIYRKSHIPESPGYHEKFYFAPGDTGFKVWSTRHGRVGVGICWDQWFPEAARSMALAGAELLVYPTAIGSEPQDPKLDSRDQWWRVMQGHAAANVLPVAAANRFGVEVSDANALTFYGSSFVTDHTGAFLQAAERAGESVLVQSLNFAEIATCRRNWGVFRDRRPDLYSALSALDRPSWGNAD
jgi:N-carbamoylputrescine amidase